MQNISKDKLLEFTKNLISFKSISPNQAGCINFIENYLKNLGMYTIRVDRDDTSNLIATFNNTNSISFAYAGHIDVVPPGDLNHWDSDPFKLKQQYGKLYGRGIADMKGSVAAFIIALEHYIKNHTKPDIAILLTSDEESSAVNGMPVIVEYLKQHQFNFKYCVLGEPTSVSTLGDVIKIGRRGSLNAHVQISGKQGHVAYPDLCKNPIHLFAQALMEISSTTWDNGNEYFPPTSLQFTNIHSGIGVNNVIPGALTASFNIRFNDLQTADSLKAKIIEILNKYDLEFDAQWENNAQPFITQGSNLTNIIQSAIFELQHITPLLKTDGGTSDGRFLIEVSKELVEFGLNNSTIHQVNENINETDLYTISDIYYKILNKIFNE